MDNKIDEMANIPLAYHEMCETRSHKTLIVLIIAWAVSLIAAVGIFAYMWLQYDYVTTTETTGVYVVTDSQGNIIASDLEPEDVIRIIGELGNGNRAENAQPEA